MSYNPGDFVFSLDTSSLTSIKWKVRPQISAVSMYGTDTTGKVWEVTWYRGGDIRVVNVPAMPS